MRTILAIALGAVLLTTTVGAETIPQIAPVTNGEFEIAAYPARLATCTVFGHDDVNVFEPGNPHGLPWLVIVSPCDGSAMRAAGWSASRVTHFTDADDDGDREARIQAITDPNHFGNPNVGVNHNMWQAYPNLHQAFTAHFDALTFRVESGEVPSNAAIIFSLQSFPVGTQEPIVPYLFDCQLRFPASLMTPDADGAVTLDPLDATFTSRAAQCNDLAAQFNAAGATDDDKRSVLSSVRVVQHSYWNFNHGADDVVLDGISIDGARSVPEGALGL